MGVMTRWDEFSVDIGVMQQFRGLYRRLKLEGALRRSSARARDGAYRLQAHALDGLQTWKDYARCETAGANAADPHFITKARPWCHSNGRQAPVRHGGRVLVLADSSVQAPVQIRACFCTLLDNGPMLAELGKRYLFPREHLA